MIREDRFVISRRPYAVDLDSLHLTQDGERYDGAPIYTVTLAAVWFRRRNKLTVACVGHLRDIQSGDAPADAAEFLARHDDGRYGGDCHGRWDGTGYWGAQEPEVIEQHLALLRPMLANFPAIPPGYDGWWRFAPATP
ncbi:hypothetical protein [Streptomyces chumphonensis]|uniref:hypothetical protein n=1 Tax=Streptomyces chumphonensis TaxID=1214925 RepID=UPI003D735C78